MTKYNFLTFVSDAGVNKHNKKLWKLLCDCGQYTVCVASAVRSGKVKSCGHLKVAGNRRSHNKHNTKEYVAWCNMKARCNNPSHRQYKDYGGRGVKYDLAWGKFEGFLAAVGEAPSPDHTLDRIDVNGDYTTENIRWATRDVQARNTRVNVWVEIDGGVKCLYDWCEVYGISPASVYRRLAKGIDMRTAITTPKHKRFSN